MHKFLRVKILSFLLALTALLAGLSPATFSARAQAPTRGQYACILQEHTYFYATPKADQPLFLLPTTYYVRLLDYGEGYSRVEYLYDGEYTKKLTGYVATELLTFVDYLPKQPYFYHVFEVSYRIDAPQGGGFLDELTATCAYYGDFISGGIAYCYALRGDTFGYLPKPADLIVPVNTEYADHLAQTPAPTPTTTEEKESSPAQIAILVALCLLVPLLATLILKSPKRPPYDPEA